MDGNFVALALTAAGTVPAALGIQFIIQVIKMVPQLASLMSGREKLASFIMAFLVVAAAFYIGLTAVPPTQELSLFGLIGAILAGFSIARLAMAAYDDFVAKAKASDPEPTGSRPTESVLNATGWTGK